MSGTFVDGAASALRKQATVDFSEVVRFLNENLGPSLTAFMAGVDKNTIGRWASGRQLPRNDIKERRLRGAYQVFVLLQSKEANHTIRAWFMGMNPQLDDASPAEEIAEDRLPEVMTAARAFISGG